MPCLHRRELRGAVILAPLLGRESQLAAEHPVHLLLQPCGGALVAGASTHLFVCAPALGAQAGLPGCGA